MNRREFLLIVADGSDGRRSIATLDCQRLFLCLSDARALSSAIGGQQDAGLTEWWQGEPPTEVSVAGADNLFRDTALALVQDRVKILQVTGWEWLREAELVDRMDELLADFRARGGEVRYATADATMAIRKATGQAG